MVLMPDTRLEEAEQFAESLRATMAGTTGPSGEPITLSIGVAHYPSSDPRIDLVLRAADQALYAAKRQGRNQVIVAAGDGDGPREPAP
ncbi:Diguanylate cyclase DgcM [compost metagenome]